MTNLKRILFECALTESRVFVAYVVVPGLDLPKEQMVDGGHVLYGEDMAMPMRDLEINDNGISASLSLHLKSQKTFVPWDAIVRMEAPGRFISLWPIELDGHVVVRTRNQVAS